MRTVMLAMLIIATAGIASELHAIAEVLKHMSMYTP